VSDLIRRLSARAATSMRAIETAQGDLCACASACDAASADPSTTTAQRQDLVEFRMELRRALGYLNEFFICLPNHVWNVRLSHPPEG